MNIRRISPDIAHPIDNYGFEMLMKAGNIIVYLVVPLTNQPICLSTGAIYAIHSYIYIHGNASFAENWAASNGGEKVFKHGVDEWC